MTDSSLSPRQDVSRRRALTVGGGLAAAASAGVLGAAEAAAAERAPAASNGAGRAQTTLSVSLEQAKAVLRAAEREAARINVPAFILVIDACGDVKASARQDGNSPASLTLAPLKAQTALAFRTATATLAQRTTDPVRAQSFLSAGFTLLGGGLPISRNGQVIGAIGVGGGSPDQDVQIAEAGLAALGR